MKVGVAPFGARVLTASEIREVRETRELENGGGCSLRTKINTVDHQI